MQNPQERSLSWLAGILEAEGSISFQAYVKPNNTVMIQPYICITNTDNLILDESKRILNLILKDHKNAKPRICGHSSTNKPCWILRLDGRAVKDVLIVLLPYIIGEKKRNAEVVIKYINGRSENLLSRDTLGRLKRNGYTRQEIELVSSIRTSKRAKSSETLRKASNVSG